MPVVRIAGPAAKQVARARAWWVENRNKAPSAFDDDFGSLVEQLARNPEIVGRPLRRSGGARRAYLRRIRYYVYFRIEDEGATVNILAVWHGSRGTDPVL